MRNNDLVVWAVIIGLIGFGIWWEVHKFVAALAIWLNVESDAAASVLAWSCGTIVLAAVGLVKGFYRATAAFSPAMVFWSITPALDYWSWHSSHAGYSMTIEQAWYGSGWFQIPTEIALLAVGIWFLSRNDWEL